MTQATPAYITADDLTSFFSADEMANLAASGSNADALIAATNAEVHTYLAAFISDNTLNTVPAGVKVKAADIARFYLYKDSASATVLARWQAANAFLTQVASGVIPLQLDLSPPAGSDDVDAGVWSQAGTSWFTERESRWL